MVKLANKKSIVFSFLITYLLILFVPISIGFIIYAKSSQIIEEEINRANAAVLKQLQQNVDKRLDDALRLSTDIALDPKIISMVNIAGQYEARQYYDFIGLKKGFLSYQAANSFIEEIYIYFRNNQLILSGSGTYDPEMFFHKTYGNNLEFEAWQDFMGDMHRREFVQMHEIGTGTIDKKFIVLAQSLPLEYAGGSNATLIIHLADSVFKESIQKTRWLDQGTIQIVNNSNDLLYTTSKDGGTEPTVRYDAISGTEGNLKLKNVSEDVIVSYIQSGIADWTQ